MDDVAKPIKENNNKMLESKYSEASDKRHGQNIYPVLPSVPTEDTLPSARFGTNLSESASATSGHVYRLQKISKIQKEIENERGRRNKLSKKYHRAVRIISTVDSVLLGSTITLGAVGIGFLTTIIAAPVVIACEGIALGAGLLSVIGGQVNKKLILKAEKHEKIKVLADSKLNTIDDYTSKALIDGDISDEEFKLILNELEKFQVMLEQIRTKVRGQIDEQTKESLINQGREEAIKSFQNMFKK